jgi:hypothetical protein
MALCCLSFFSDLTSAAGVRAGGDGFYLVEEGEKVLSEVEVMEVSGDLGGE